MTEDFETMIRETWRGSSDRSLVRSLVYATRFDGAQTPEFCRFRGRAEKIDPRALETLKALALERFPDGVPPEKVREFCPELVGRL